MANLNYLVANSPLLTAVTTPGDCSNKINAGKEQFKENLSTGAQVAATAVGTGAAAAMAMKYNPVRDSFAKAFDLGAKSCWKLSQILNNFVCKKAFKLDASTLNVVNKFDSALFSMKLKSIPKKVKALTAIALPAILIANHIQRKHDFKSGQINQKHKDIAKVREKTQL